MLAFRPEGLQSQNVPPLGSLAEDAVALLLSGTAGACSRRDVVLPSVRSRPANGPQSVLKLVGEGRLFLPQRIAALESFPVLGATEDAVAALPFIGMRNRTCTPCSAGRNSSHCGWFCPRTSPEPFLPRSTAEDAVAALQIHARATNGAAKFHFSGMSHPERERLAIF
jgi:hypothetical protein